MSGVRMMEVSSGDLCRRADLCGAVEEAAGPVRIFANAKERDRTNK